MSNGPVTLAQVKSWLKLEPTDSGGDAQLALLAIAACRTVENHTGRTIAADWPDAQDPDVKVLGQAALFLIASWYVNREAVISGAIPTEMPLGVSYLLEPLRKWVC